MPNLPSLQDSSRQGLFFAFGAFGFWGFVPIYFKAVSSALPLEVLAHRVLWSVILLTAILIWQKNLGVLPRVLKQPKLLATLVLSSVLVATNWLIFIWAVANDRIAETSLGYYITPLMSVLLAIVFLHERLRTWQWVAIGLAAAGIINQIINYGELPLVAIGVALSFSLYGLVRKKLAAEPVMALAMETWVLLPAALAYLGWMQFSGKLAFAHQSLQLDGLLIAAGLVTSIPLLLFAAAANRLPLSTVGIIQYLTPTMSFLLAIFLYEEPFNHKQLITFVLIWSALILFSSEGFYHQKKQKSRAKAGEETLGICAD